MSLYCFYCGEATTWSPTSAHLYSRDYGPVWECRPCEAWVGCHRNGDGRRSKGTPANAQDRELRKQAHAAFDPLWRRRKAQGDKRARYRGYRWLADEMDMRMRDCHIGMMHGDQLRQVIRCCSPPFGLYPLPDSAPVRYNSGWVRVLVTAQRLAGGGERA